VISDKPIAPGVSARSSEKFLMLMRAIASSNPTVTPKDIYKWLIANDITISSIALSIIKGIPHGRLRKKVISFQRVNSFPLRSFAPKKRVTKVMMIKIERLVKIKCGNLVPINPPASPNVKVSNNETTMLPPYIAVASGKEKEPFFLIS